MDTNKKVGNKWKIALIALASVVVLFAGAFFTFWLLMGRPSPRFVDASQMRTRTFTAEELARSGLAGNAVHMVQQIELAHPIFLPIPQVYGLLPDDYEEIREWFLEYASRPDITDIDFGFAAMRYIATLQDGHMSGDILMVNEHGIRPRMAQGGTVLDVTWTLQDGNLFLEDGLQVLEIGGVPVSEIFAVIDRYYFHENEFYRDWDYTLVSRYSRIIERAGGEVLADSVAVTLYDNGDITTRFIPHFIPWIDRDFNPFGEDVDFIIRHEMIDDIFYIDFRSFVVGDHITETAAAISQAVADGTRHFIIDIRGNGGGNDAAGMALLEAMGITPPRPTIIHRPNRVAANSVANGGHSRFDFPIWSLFGVDYLLLESNIPENNNPNDVFVSVLTSMITYSSATLFTYVVQDSGFGNVIGSPSRNSPNMFGNMVTLFLPYYDMAVRLSYGYFMRPDATADPNVVWPDIIVDPAYALDVAVEFLRGLGSSETETAEILEISETIEATEILFIGERAREEYLEDLDYLYYILSNNFPFWGVIQRRADVNLRQLFADTRQYIETTLQIADDNAFFDLLEREIFRPVNSMGHLQIIDRSFVLSIIRLFSFSAQQGLMHAMAYIEPFDNPAARAFYNLTDDDFPSTAVVLYENGENDENTQQPTVPQNFSVTQTQIIEHDKIAMVRISSMDSLAMENDAARMLDFFREIGHFEHLIVDIRGNRGGSSGFFPYVIMRPLLAEPVTHRFFTMYSTHEHNMHFLEARQIPTDNLITEELLERLPYFNTDDLAYVDVYLEQEFVIHPSQPQPLFNGKIWLMIDRFNFSASENAAQIAQETGFATLVGEQTGGDGIGMDPSIIVLPNTGIAFLYSSCYGTDSFGRNNQEFGTTPDIELPQPGGALGLSALLQIIRSGEWE
ncbi:MAG: S41 family peptidase [Defluviitaleaceae bacterium]|nr:S41 family peptidase [Defluviitaleaceae bacterium]